jgi:hypothetical protein
MSRTLFSITAELFLAGGVLVVVCVLAVMYSPTAAGEASEQTLECLQDQPTDTVYEGRIKDLRPAWGDLVLTVPREKGTRDVNLNMREARIVGPSGGEWKADDLRIGDRVRVELTADRTLVQQINFLEE